VPGIGEKTASKLIGQYGSVENLLAHSSELKGKLKEALQAHRDNALLSKRLATINCDSPCDADLERLKLQPMNAEAVKQLCVEFEFNSIGKRLFGEDFRAGRGYVPSVPVPKQEMTKPVEPAPPANFRAGADVPHTYTVAATTAEQATLAAELKMQKSVCLQID